MDLGSFPSWTVKVGPENPRSLKMMNPNSHHMNGFVAVNKLSIYIIGRAKRAPHWGVQSRFRVIYIYIYIYVGMYVCRGPKSVGGITWAKCAHAQSQYWAVKSDQ